MSWSPVGIKRLKGQTPCSDQCVSSPHSLDRFFNKLASRIEGQISKWGESRYPDLKCFRVYIIQLPNYYLIAC